MSKRGIEDKFCKLPLVRTALSCQIYNSPLDTVTHVITLPFKTAKTPHILNTKLNWHSPFRNSDKYITVIYICVQLCIFQQVSAGKGGWKQAESSLNSYAYIYTTLISNIKGQA